MRGSTQTTQTALRYKVEMEYEAKPRDRCGHCGDKLEVGRYGKRGIKSYCSSCIEEPSKLIAIFSQPGEVSRVASAQPWRHVHVLSHTLTPVHPTDGRACPPTGGSRGGEARPAQVGRQMSCFLDSRAQRACLSFSCV